MWGIWMRTTDSAFEVYSDWSEFKDKRWRFPSRKDLTTYLSMVTNIVRDFISWLHDTIQRNMSPPSSLEVDGEIHSTITRILNTLRKKFPTDYPSQISKVGHWKLPMHLIPLIEGKRYDDLVHFLRRYSEDTIRQVVQTMNTATIEGWSPSERKSALALMLMQKEWEAERVSRTEGVRLTNYTLYSHYGDLGIVVGWRYDVVLDGRTSKICLPLANKVVRHTDRTLIPPLHPNCRTLLVPIFDEKEIDRAADSIVDDDYVADQLPNGWWAYEGHTPKVHKKTGSEQEESTYEELR